MKKSYKNIIILVLSSILISLIYFTYKNEDSNVEGELEINYIDVGQGNGVLIRQGDKSLIIDGGNRSNSRYFYNYIDKKNTGKIDYIIASHYDEDHIAGLVGILENKKVNRVLCPDYKKDTKIYKSFMNSLKNSNAKAINPKMGDEFNLNEAKVKILWPKEYKEGTDNDNSIVVKVNFGKNSFLFPADAGKSVEDELIYSGYSLKSDVLMLGHHGSKYSSSNEFLKEVRPKLAIISVGENNRYKHPSNKLIKSLDGMRIKYLRTDQDGDIVLRSDGEKIKISTNKENK